jgi:predicted dehydrogenase
MIWLEKPPTLTLQDLDRLIALREANGGTTKILVNYTRRYWDVYQRSTAFTAA